MVRYSDLAQRKPMVTVGLIIRSDGITTKGAKNHINATPSATAKASKLSTLWTRELDEGEFL